MILLLVASAFAGEPVIVLPVAMSVSVPELGEVTVRDDGHGWRSPIVGGGFVRVTEHADVESAVSAFAFDKLSAASRTMDASTWEFADEAVGDGAGILLFRLAHRVVLVRDHGGDAAGVGARIAAGYGSP